MPSSSSGLLQLPQPFGPFVLERRIAVGGSAEVFLARPKRGQLPAPRLVVKRLLPAMRQSSAFSVLQHEADLHRAVTHPNVVTVFGAGMVDEEPYLAMEYVEGVDLYRLLRRAETERRPFTPGLAAFIARNVADALAAVHTARDAEGNELHIVHRDVTPSNVYLSLQGDVKLGDFGIARAKNAKAVPHTAGLKGKFGYLAPEQVAGEPFDHRADIFTLTVLLGEMLIGERIFPGSGQLAVLLAIRDVNIEPLRRARSTLPPSLYEVCEQGLMRDPEARFQTTAEFSRALTPFEVPSRSELKATLSEWVAWAQDSSQLARRIEGQIRDSVQRMRAVREKAKAAGGELLESAPPPSNALSAIRRTDGRELHSLAVPTVIEMVATGELDADDEVSLIGNKFRRIRDIPELARHLLPSTTATTNQLFEPGAPDYQELLEITPMTKVLARMRQNAETGVLFAHGADPSLGVRRKEIYLDRGRLLHVASSEREELLGEYLVRRGRLERRQLEVALSRMTEFGGRLGDTLIGLGLVDAVSLFRNIRDQGRDRVAAICGWTSGRVVFYRGTAPTQVQFPLDLDLASPMMAGAIVSSKGKPRELLPPATWVLVPGPRYAALADSKERGTVPISMQLVPGLVEQKLTLKRALAHLMARPPGAEARVVGEKEACAAFATSHLLGWIGFREP